MASTHDFPRAWLADPQAMRAAPIAELRAWRGALREILWDEIGGNWCDADSFAATMDLCDIGDFGGTDWAEWWRDAHSDAQIVGHRLYEVHQARVRALHLYKLTVQSLCHAEQAELRSLLQSAAA